MKYEKPEISEPIAARKRDSKPPGQARYLDVRFVNPQTERHGHGECL